MKKIIFVSVLLAAVCACTKENPSSQKNERGLYPMTISVDVIDDDDDAVADDTKTWTYYNPTEKKFKFRWNGGGNEKLSAFDNVCTTAGGHQFLTANAKNAKADLNGSVCAESTGPVAFLNPYQSNHWDKTWSGTQFIYDTKYDVANNKITEVFIPYDYSKLDAGNDKTGTLTDSRLVRVGVLPSKESTALALYNPLAAVYFNLTGSSVHKVTKIEIFGNNSEKLAGYCDIDVSTPNAPQVVFFPEPYLSKEKGHRVAYDLFLNTGGTELIDAQYIAALAPANFTQGLTIKFTDNQGNVAFKTSSAALNIQTNHIRNLGTFNVDALDWHFAMDLRFIPGAYLKTNNTVNNPFSNSILTNKNTRNAQTFALKDGSGKTVNFYTYVPADGSEIGYYDNGLNLKGVGGYIEIPALEGKVLKKIFFRASATGGKNGQPCIVRASDGYYLSADGTFESGATNADIWTGDSKNRVYFGQYKSWSNCFAAGESYRIQITDAAETMKIMNLVLVYDDVTRASAISNPQIDEWVPGTEAETIMY